MSKFPNSDTLLQRRPVNLATSGTPKSDPINNRNWTDWSTIQGKIRQVISNLAKLSFVLVYMCVSPVSNYIFICKKYQHLLDGLTVLTDKR